MMIAMILFGLNLSPLYKAIAAAESHRGATSGNTYQIRNEHIIGVNRSYDLRDGTEYRRDDVLDRCKSEMIMYLYWKYWAYRYAKETGGEVTYELLAKMHNQGGGYWKRADKTVNDNANSYWRKVEVQLDNELRRENHQ